MPLSLKLKMDEIVSKSLDSVDFMRYMDPDLFDLDPLTQYFLRDNEKEELFAEAAIQLPKVVAEAEVDEIFSQAAALAEQRTGHSSPVASKILESSVSQSTTSKFGAPVDLDLLKVCAIPEKTKQQTNWCVLRWREWAKSQNSDQDSMGEVASVELIELSDKELAY